MTVPVAGGGVLGARKPLYRCIPEIHVTRLSVSGSLRPKLGLLLLSIVLVVSLCLLGVPLVTKVLVPLVHNSYHNKPATDSPIIPFFYQLFSAVTKGSETRSIHNNLVLSPWLVEASLSNLAVWTQGETREEIVSNTENCTNCTEVVRKGIMLKQVFFVPSQQVKEDMVTRYKEIEKLDFRVKEAKDQIRQWMLATSSYSIDTDWVVNEVDNSQMVGLNTAAVNISIGTTVMEKFHTQAGQAVETKMSRVEGDFLTAKLTHSTVIVMDNVEESLLLCLVLPHASSPMLGNGLECRSPLLSRKRLEVTVPSFTITSRLALAAHLRALKVDRIFSHEAEFGTISSQQGLTLTDIYQTASIQIQEDKLSKVQKQNTRDIHAATSIVLNRPFIFLVEQKTSNRTFMVGKFCEPSVVTRNK